MLGFFVCNPYFKPNWNGHENESIVEFSCIDFTNTFPDSNQQMLVNQKSKKYFSNFSHFHNFTLPIGRKWKWIYFIFKSIDISWWLRMGVLSIYIRNEWLYRMLNPLHTGVPYLKRQLRKILTLPKITITQNNIFL